MVSTWLSAQRVCRGSLRRAGMSRVKEGSLHVLGGKAIWEEEPAGAGAKAEQRRNQFVSLESSPSQAYF